MQATVRRWARAIRSAATRAYRKVETRILAHEGRKALRAKAQHAGAVARSAAKTGAVVGTVTAAMVLRRELRKRRLARR